MKTSIKIFRPDGTVEDRDVSDIMPAQAVSNGALRELLTPILEGAHYEHVTVLHGGGPADMFVDEDGHEKGLPINGAATAIYRAYWLAGHPAERPDSLPAIMGPAVLFSRRVWF